ncbi:UNVERIFIED_CONTAM: hypothetical protein Sradi_2646200 [Sesamum radiatum]|uniref:Uncharacterized protein n=1 Tax=Sesamum radiatum TaxID=300843 RepID=A0AAW2S5B5_SESRA
MDWVQMMVFAATRPSYLFASSHEGVPDDGTRSCPVDAGTSSYVYDGGGYDESGLTYLFSNIVHAADQPLWDGLQPISIRCFSELVDIKVDGHISKRIYDRISQWTNRILPSNHTLPGDYYKTKKLVKDLGLPVEKIHACKNGYMLYWKDDIDLEYCKFCREGRYKPARGATAEHMTWHATHQTDEGSIYHPSDAEAWKYFDWIYTDFIEEPRNIRLGLCTDGFVPHGQYGHAVQVSLGRSSLRHEGAPKLSPR